MEILWIVLGGAFGGLIKVLFDGEHKLAKPVFVGNYFYLGFIGNMLIGISAAILGISYFISSFSNIPFSQMDPLRLLATSIAFGMASNAIIEGVIERFTTKKDNKSS